MKLYVNRISRGVGGFKPNGFFLWGCINQKWINANSILDGTQAHFAPVTLILSKQNNSFPPLSLILHPSLLS